MQLKIQTISWEEKDILERIVQIPEDTAKAEKQPQGADWVFIMECPMSLEEVVWWTHANWILELLWTTDCYMVSISIFLNIVFIIINLSLSHYFVVGMSGRG